MNPYLILTQASKIHAFRLHILTSSLLNWALIWRSCWAVTVDDSESGAQPQSAGGIRGNDRCICWYLAHFYSRITFLRAILPLGHFSFTVEHGYFAQLACRQCAACAWNGVSEPKVSDRSGGDAAFCCTLGRFRASHHEHLPLNRNNVMWKNGIHYVKIHFNLFSAPSSRNSTE